MADAKPQNQEGPDPNPQGSATPQDYYAVLKKVVDDVTRDPALLRKLVYALAWQNLRPEQILAKPITDARSHAKTIYELEKALQLERAIERIEAEAIERAQASRTSEIAARPVETKPAPIESGAIDPAPAVPIAKNPDEEHRAAQKPAAPSPIVESFPATPLVERNPEVEAWDALFEPPRAGGPVVVPSEQGPRPERKDIVEVERIPTWLDPGVRVAPHAVELGPMRPPPKRRFNLFRVFLLIAVPLICVMLYIVIVRWPHVARRDTTAAPAAAQQAATAPQTAVGPTPAVNQGRSTAAGPAAGPQPIRFPLPRAFGVYAGVPGQLFELQPLPIKVPDPRVLVSAEITSPSRVTTPGENLSFVVFRRDVVNGAPQNVSVRVVARVQRTTKLVNGRPGIVPLDGIWRIRPKAYELKVSPLEGHNEMVVLQPSPGFVFPPGRYALVLNGFGYDFTVAGEITAPEQCLEQVEAANGTVLSECPKT